MSGGSITPTGTGKQLSLKRSEEAPITYQGWLSKQVFFIYKRYLIRRVIKLTTLNCLSTLTFELGLFRAAMD